jgi:hypothetical protein
LQRSAWYPRSAMSGRRRDLHTPGPAERLPPPMSLARARLRRHPFPGNVGRSAEARLPTCIRRGSIPATNRAPGSRRTGPD